MQKLKPLLLSLLAVTATAAEAQAAAPVTDPVALLQAFVRTRTVNPPGNETALTGPLAEQLRAAGVEVELTGATPERQNLIARIRGTTDAKPWLFLAHVDTVLANPAEWRVDPFAGAISDGVLWGRGALDDKGMAAALAAALMRLAAEPRPRRGVIAVFAADEETGSKNGIEWLLARRPELADVAGVINEGGFAILDEKGPAPKTYYVSVGEKGVAWIRLTATGTPGHGSVRWGNNANDKLLRALGRIVDWPHPISNQGPLGEFAMAELAKRGKPARSVEVALRNHPLGKVVERDPKARSTLSNTCNVTVLKAGEKPNVIPAASEAIVDCRVVPGVTPERFLVDARLRIADPDVKVELVTQSTPTLSPWRTPLFKALGETARGIDGASLVVPVLAAGATDSRFWREKGVVAYGIVPIPVPGELVLGMHGVDERVPVAGIREGADFLTALLRKLTSE